MFRRQTLPSSGERIPLQSPLLTPSISHFWAQFQQGRRDFASIWFGRCIFRKRTRCSAHLSPSAHCFHPRHQSHPRGKLFQEILLKGPYEDIGEIPTTLVGQRLSDDDVASVIAFIYSHMINCFKGAITELLAVRPCLNLMKKLQKAGKLSRSARLYLGDSVGIHRAKGKGLLKGADLHILIGNLDQIQLRVSS